MKRKEPGKPTTPSGKRAKSRQRYGIGEWYGKLLVGLDPSERRKFAEIQFQAKRDRPRLPCPFRSTTQGNVPCTKEGGVCTLRLYHSGPTADSVTIAPGETASLVTTCPYRFQEGEIIYRWIGETLLLHKNPLLVSEIGFLEQESGGDIAVDESPKEDVGRIDCVLVHPSMSPLSWCALEVQAVYFSGGSMKREFEALRTRGARNLPFPSAHRRPDFRSSGPKRLMPQLQIKVPTLRRWGKKMAVVVDRPFFNSLGKMEAVKDVSSCDIAWFVVGYEQKNGRAVLKPDFVRLTTLERAVEGLTGGNPVALSEFEARIREKLTDVYPKLGAN